MGSPLRNTGGSIIKMPSNKIPERFGAIRLFGVAQQKSRDYNNALELALTNYFVQKGGLSIEKIQIE